MRPRRLFALMLLPLAALVMALNGCGFSAVPCEPVVEFAVTADLDASRTRLAQAVVIPAGATRTYQINLPASRQLLVVEAVPSIAGPGLTVSLLNSRCGVLGRSNQASLFGLTLPSLSSAAQGSEGAATPAASELKAQSIVVEGDWFCDGPCVGTPGAAGTYSFEVTNSGSSARFFDLYAYAPPLVDGNEPNGAPALALPTFGLATLGGAIEWVGDEDWFVYRGSAVRSLELQAASAALGLRLAIPGVGSIASGDSIDIFPNEAFVVYSGSDRAGAAHLSGYQVLFGAPTATVLQATPSPQQLTSSFMAPGATRRYLVSVPNPSDLLFFEAVGTGLRVQITSLLDGALVASNSPTSFAAAGAIPLAVAAASELDAAEPGAADLFAQSIVPTHRCLGPCAAVAPSAPRYLMEVRNVGSLSTNAEIFAYTIPAFDAADRGSANNDRSTRAVVIPGPTTLRGAIELVGDDDWFRYTGPNATLVLLPDSNALDLRVQFALTFGSFAPNTPIALPSGTFFRVYSSTQRAGPAESSAYTLVVQ